MIDFSLSRIALDLAERWERACAAISRGRRLISWVLALAATATGCAATYTDANGTKHIIGLTKVEIRQPADRRTIAGDVVEVTVIGIGIYNTEAHGGFVLGYSREVSAAIRDNALIIGNPLQAIRESPTD